MIFLLIFLFVIACMGFSFYLNYLSYGKVVRRRQDVQAQLNAARAQMNAFHQQSLSLDPATAQRVGEAQAAVNGKLDQAATLLTTAVKDRHFERIGRIQTQVQAKLGNVQASLGRAQARADARVQRQTEAEQRREEARAQKATQRATRGSFAAPTQTTGAQTDWNTIPTNDRGVCFFCSRPCLLRELTPVTVPIAGQAQQVLACPQDLATVRTGNLPPIRAFTMDGRQVPWYAYNRYNPYHDYYANGYGVNYYIDTYPFSIIDPFYWNFNTSYAYDNGPAYVFSPTAEPYQDYASAQAAGAGMENTNVGGMDFANANVGGVNFQSGSDFAPGGQGADYQNMAGDFAAGPDAS